jgi:anti-sigma B factor antagonist
MEIGVSFEAGIPVLALEGPLDGPGAIEFDEQVSALHTGAVQWVIDLSGVGYLSSLGIRSLVALEQRLRARDGGLVLAALTPLVQKVLHVSRLDDVLRIVPTAAAAIETARAAAAADPTIEMTLSRWRAKVRRLQGTESTVEWWSPATSAGSRDQLLGINASPRHCLRHWSSGRRSRGSRRAGVLHQHAALRLHALCRGRNHRLHRRRRLTGRADWRRVSLRAVRCSCGGGRAGGHERFFIVRHARRALRPRRRRARSEDARVRRARAHPRQAPRLVRSRSGV